MATLLDGASLATHGYCRQNAAAVLPIDIIGLILSYYYAREIWDEIINKSIGNDKYISIIDETTVKYIKGHNSYANVFSVNGVYEGNKFEWKLKINNKTNFSHYRHYFEILYKETIIIKLLFSYEQFW